MREKKTILITGGTGFIGYHLAKQCLKFGWQVTSISTKAPKKIRYLNKVNYLYCDITNKKFLKKKINKKYDYIVNLGGHVDHKDEIRTFKSHFYGLRNIANIFLEKKPKAFVQVGSCAEYGGSKSPQKESQNCKTKSKYGLAKLNSTRYLINLFKKKKFPSVVIRLYQAYGPRQDFNRLIPIVIKACRRNEKFNCSDGNQLRDFTYIDDIIDAIIKSLKKKKAQGNIINIGSGRPKKIKNIISFLKKINKGGHPQYGKIKLRKDETLVIYPSIKKARQLIGWKPKTSFQTGIRKTINFYNGQKL